MRGRITIFTPMFINSLQKEKIERVEDAFSEFLDFEFKKHIKCRQETTSLCRKITFVVFVFACLTRLRIHNPPFHVYELVVPLSLTLLTVIGVACHLAYKNISYFIGVGSEKRVRMMNLLRILSEELRQTRGVQFDAQQFDPQQTTISLADAKAISLADAKDRVSRMVSAPLPPFPKDHLKVVFVISGASLVLLFSWVIWLLSLGDDDSTMFSGGQYAAAT